MKALSSSKGLFLQSLTRRTLSSKRMRGPHFSGKAVTAAEIWTAIAHKKVFSANVLQKQISASTALPLRLSVVKA